MALSKTRIVAALILLAGLVLAGCSPAGAANTGASDTGAAQGSAAAPGRTSIADGQTQTDKQGAVTVAVTPVNMGTMGQSLDFTVVLDSASVDLSMDLTKHATLETDDGMTVQAVRWQGDKGGQHVQGTLSFPAWAGGEQFAGATSTLTMRIVGVDAPQRVFSWNLR